MGFLKFRRFSSCVVRATQAATELCPPGTAGLRRRRFAPVLVLVPAVALLALGLANCGGTETGAKPPAETSTTFSITTTYPSLQLPTAVANVPYGFGFQTNIGQSGIEGIPPVYYELGSGATMPPGLTLSPTGFITGTPTQPGRFNVAIAAVDSSPTPLVATTSFSLTVLQPGAVLTEVAHINLGGHGQNADVSVAVSSANGKPYAFVGTRGVAGSCPATGVKIVDVSNVTAPQMVGTVAALAGSTQETPRVTTGVSSPAFHSGSGGDILAVPLQPCNSLNATPAEEGVEFYDVTDPTHPSPLGIWQSGVDGVNSAVVIGVPGPTNTLGQVNQAQNRIFALVSVPGSEAAGGEGDLRVLDLTNPNVPIEIGNWGVLKALDYTVSQLAQGQDQRVFLSSIELSSDNKLAYLGYWDAGVVILNVSDPTVVTSSNPAIFQDQALYPITQLATSSTPSEPEGNTHMALPVLGGQALLVTDDVCASGTTTNPSNPGETVPTNPYVASVCGAQDDVTLDANAGWGYLRTYTLTTPSSATIASFFVTPQSQSFPAPDDGIYTAHNLAWNGNMSQPHGYVSWYSNGVIDLDLTSITPPNELAAWVPPATPDPNGSNPAVNNPDEPLVYGVAALTQNGQPYILASDINSGLWVVQETPAPALTILTSSLPVGNVNVPYSAQLSAINGSVGTSNYLWSIDDDTEDPLPAGLTLSGQGAITGTPTTSGTSVVTFDVNDGNGNVTTETITMQVNQTFQILPPTVPLATTKEPYTLTLSSVNGVAPITWTIVGGTLPNGLLLGPTTGEIFGTPSGLGTSNFIVQATDSSPVPLTNTLAFSITSSPLTFQTLAVPAGGQGVTYTQVIAMANGTPPFTPVVTSGSLPPGLSVTPDPDDTNVDFLLEGTPTTPGTYSFTVQVTDADGAVASQPFTLVINPFTVTTTSLPPAQVGYGYLYSLVAQNGVAPYTYTLISGQLPPGLSMDSSGNITGVPASGSAGTYNFVVQMVDTNQVVTTVSLSLVVNP